MGSKIAVTIQLTRLSSFRRCPLVTVRQHSEGRVQRYVDLDRPPAAYHNVGRWDRVQLQQVCERSSARLRLHPLPQTFWGLGGSGLQHTGHQAWLLPGEAEVSGPDNADDDYAFAVARRQVAPLCVLFSRCSLNKSKRVK